MRKHAHLIDEYAEAPNIDVDREIAKARRQVGVRLVSITPGELPT